MLFIGVLVECLECEAVQGASKVVLICSDASGPGRLYSCIGKCAGRATGERWSPVRGDHLRGLHIREQGPWISEHISLTALNSRMLSA
eukprot:1616266-Amphidinium_carterae.1